ncbi:Protein of unknown function [Lactobacillus helveticus CIRM-BIA 953]|uniref:Uncharacterized protein n=1 Tax=Lactobacillus helveticus CIRM-BIA 953 TaxID=1226335 RepID=U4QJF1_LACHE|nr:Protein of unknown function [Lactobacillus helveticus CIRM-BIA 953]
MAAGEGLEFHLDKSYLLIRWMLTV